jgi:hypothetical protein
MADKKTLDIFNNFVVDYNLPKHKKEMDTSGNIGSYVATGSSAVTNSMWSVNNFVMSDNNNNSVSIGDIDKSRKNSLIKKMFNWISHKKTQITALPVSKAFELVLKSKEEIAIYETRINTYKKLIENAQKLGQIALVEKLKDNEFVNKFESQLFAIDFKKFITEEQLATICEKCEKGLRLDWIKNFTRVIPEEAIAVKEKLDALKIFDNYVILHFDPENRNRDKTKQEKDPILFGVIRESRKLYFIYDWVDELCDLTFDKILDFFSETEKKDLEIQDNKFHL